jgi:hypothetical protein
MVLSSLEISTHEHTPQIFPKVWDLLVVRSINSTFVLGFKDYNHVAFN